MSDVELQSSARIRCAHIVMYLVVSAIECTSRYKHLLALNQVAVLMYASNAVLQWICYMSCARVTNPFGNMSLDTTICMPRVCSLLEMLHVLQPTCVRPVLKRGPRSLVYVQVRNRDRSVHNKCNNMS